MTRKADSFLVAAYLLLCIVLGGSAQGVWGNLALEVLGIGLVAYAAVRHREVDPGSSLLLPILLVSTLVVILVQLIPLPANVWAGLPGRPALAAGFAAIGSPIPALPISETPNASVMTLFAAIPAIAVFVAVRTLRPEPRWIALAVLAATILAIVFGALQIAGGHNSWARLYRVTSPGAVGFFANQNHMATLLLVAIPMAVALLATTKSDRRSAAGRYGTGGVLLVLLIVGVALNGSLAAYALAVPVLLASLSLLPAGAAWRRIVLPLAVLSVVGGVSLLATRPIATGTIGTSATSSVTGRAEIWSKTTEAIADSFPIGTGLGSFEQVYRQYEDPSNVTLEYVNHAHNEYLEILLELGAAGLVLMAVFLGWWMLATLNIWTSSLSTPFARAVTIASAAVLAHSVVDFPLRTAAISAIFAASIAMMAQNLRNAPVTKKGEARPTRHVKLG